MNPDLYIGLISGTSMDAVDCALVDLSSAEPVLLDFLNLDIPNQLKSRILSLCADGQNQIQTLGETDIEVARLFSKSVLTILERNKISASQITAIGSHGQTIRHQPPQKPDNIAYTIQIGDPNTISEITGITTIADFRKHDIAAGGQGAPLVPAFHSRVFQSSSHNRIILNIGGMSNITMLHKSKGLSSGYDTGPGNVLLDIWIEQNEGKAYDHNGDWAKAGKVDEELLQLFLAEPYFQLPPPKSTGRELFNNTWLSKKLTQISRPIQAIDVQATLTELTATTISRHILPLIQSGEVIICGGGARNKHLRDTLASQLRNFRVYTSTEFGINGDAIEAMTFAWIAQQTLDRRSIDLTKITGASRPVVLGGIYYSS